MIEHQNAQMLEHLIDSYSSFLNTHNDIHILKNVRIHEKSPMEWGTYLNLGTKYVIWATFGITADDLYFGLFNLPFIYGNQQKMVITMR